MCVFFWLMIFRFFSVVCCCKTVRCLCVSVNVCLWDSGTEFWTDGFSFESLSVRFVFLSNVVTSERVCMG